MKKLMHTLLLSCLQATELIEKKLHYHLSWKEKLQLKAHKMICSACTRYEKQSALIEKEIIFKREKELKAGELQQLKQTIIEQIININK